MSLFNPTDDPIPISGQISFNQLRNTFGVEDETLTSAESNLRISASDLRNQNSLPLSQPTNNMSIAFFRGKKIPEIELEKTVPTEVFNVVYETVDNTFSSGNDFNFQKRTIRKVAQSNVTISIPVNKRGIGRILSSKLGNTNFLIQSGSVAAGTGISNTISNAATNLVTRIRRRNFVEKEIVDTVDATDIIEPMKVKFSIATTSGHTARNGTHHGTHNVSGTHNNTGHHTNHHHTYVASRRSGTRPPGRRVRHNLVEHSPHHVHHQNLPHHNNHTHNANHAFQFKTTSYQNVQFQNVSSDLTASSFQYHLASITGCYQTFSPNTSTTRTNVSGSQCPSDNQNTNCTSSAPHSRAACTTTFNVQIRPPWTTTNASGSSSVSLTNTGT